MKAVVGLAGMLVCKPVGRRLRIAARGRPPSIALKIRYLTP